MTKYTERPCLSQGTCAPFTLLPTAIEGGFLSDAEEFRTFCLLASLGQSVLATPEGLAMLWGVEKRVVAKVLGRLKSSIDVEGDGYVRQLILRDTLVSCSRAAGVTPDLSYTVDMGYRLPEGAVSFWRGRGLSVAVRNAVFDRDGRVCAYCKTTDGKFHIDHIVPVAKGGKDNPENLTVACQGCNLAKSDLALEDFLARRATL